MESELVVIKISVSYTLAETISRLEQKLDLLRQALILIEHPALLGGTKEEYSQEIDLGLNALSEFKRKIEMLTTKLLQLKAKIPHAPSEPLS
jgi:hypothetical protein